MKKRVLAMLISLVMVFVMLPTAVLAGTPAQVTIGGKTLTVTNCYYVNGEGGSPGTVTAVEPEGGEWSAYLEEDNGSLVLTLKGLNLMGYNGVGVGINAGANVFTLKLNGTNTVVASIDSDEDAVRIIGGSVTIEKEGTDGSLNAFSYGAGNGISVPGIILNSGSINGTATGSGNGINVSGNLCAQGGSAYGKAISGVGVQADLIQYGTGGGLISGSSYSSYGVSLVESVDFFIPGTLIASGGENAVDPFVTAIKISPTAGAPLTADPNWCTVTTSANADGSSPTVLPGGDAVTGTAIPYTYSYSAGSVKYLKIEPAGAGDGELVLSVTATGAPAALNTDYRYSAGKLDIIKAGSYTLSMAEGVATTAHNVEITADGVELTLDNVTIEGGAASPLKSSSAGGAVGSTLKLNGTNVLTSTSGTPGLAVNGKLTIADGDGDGTGSLTATGDEYGAGIGVSGTDEGMDLTIQSGTVTAYGGEGMLNGTLVNQGPGIGSNYETTEGQGLPEPVSVTITGGTVYAEGAGGIATSINKVEGSNGPTQITVIISGGVVTGKSITVGGCGIGGARARVEISGGTVVGESATDWWSNRVIVGAGIGGTDQQRDDSLETGVFISGGTVTATGSSCTIIGSGNHYGGAGIGGGFSEYGITSISAKVEISGGTVTATGGHNAAGIGGSSPGMTFSGGLADVTITGGTVTAVGGTGGRAIGAGNVPASDDTGSSVSIAPVTGKALLVKFADAPVTDWSGVTDRVLVGSGSTLDYKADAHYDKLSVHLSMAYAVSGTVKDAVGAPVENAAVSSGEQRTTTDADGAYTLYFESGSHAVSATEGDRQGTKNVTVNGDALTGQDITIIAPPPTVTTVAVNPASVSIQKGGSQQFNATVYGAYGPAQTVTWTVTGGIAGTSIDADGVLTVAADETATMLTVKATSTVDTEKFGVSNVTVTTPPPTVTTVAVNPASVSIQKGGSQTFNASVTGTNSPAQTVTWSVTGGVSGTSIDADGVLTVAADETAAMLTVKATSTLDTEKFGVSNVTVTTPPPTVTTVAVDPASVSIQRGGTQSFSASVTGENNPVQTVTWTVTGGVSGTGIDENGVLTVAANETATTLTVKATSTVDTSKSGTATVTVTLTAPTVTSVTVNHVSVSIQKGGTQTFSASVTGANSPAQTVTWTVTGGVSGTGIDENGVLTVAANETATTLTVKATSTVDTSKSGTATVTVSAPAPAEYQFIRGINGEWTKGGTAGLVFTADGNYADFTGVSVDGTILSSDMYTSASGSTIVTLKASFLETLSAGRHTLKVSFTDGYVETGFTIEIDSEIPPLGDNSQPWLWLGIMLLASAGIVMGFVTRRRRQNG